MTKSIILHICGVSGSGKSFLGKRLSDLFGNRIVVKDIDDIRVEFIRTFYGDRQWTVIDKDAYQAFIDEYIAKLQRQHKPIVFVGLNTMPWWHPDLFYDFQPDYRFYINIDGKQLLKQRCVRYLTEELKEITNDKIAMNDMENNNEKFLRLVCQGIKRECDKKTVSKKITNHWEKQYRDQGYTILNAEAIFRQVVAILKPLVGVKKKTRKHKLGKKRGTIRAAR